MLYNYTMKFKTHITIYLFPPKISRLLSDSNQPMTEHDIITTISAKNAPLLTDEAKERLCEAQNNTYREKLENPNTQDEIGNKITVGKTEFIGYESIEESDK